MSSSQASWKKQSSRLQTGHMKSVNNDFLYSESASFNNLESKNSYVNSFTADNGYIKDLSCNRGTFNDVSVNNLFIINLGQNTINYDKWVGLDLSKQLIVFDLSSAGNFTNYGGHSMMKNKKGWGSTAFGFDTMRNLSPNTDISFANTAVGTRAMRGSDQSDNDYVITGKYNSAFGYESLRSITSGNNNSAFGYQSLKNVTTGIHNTSVGGSSLLNNTTGNMNVAVGSLSLLTNTTGNWNTACGSSALNFNTTGSMNVAVGNECLINNKTGINNTAIGYNSMHKNVNGECNSALGTSSLYNNSGGNFNIAVGIMSLYSNTTGSNNVAVGNQALYNNVDSSGNTAVGNLSLYNNNSGLFNSAFGFNSMYNNKTGINNTAIGYNSMYKNVDNSCNTALGTFTLYNNSGGSFNVGVGYQSMYANTTGGKSTSLGNLSLFSNTTGCNNTAIGNRAMNFNVDASCNTAIGSHSMYTNTSGFNNTSLGHMSLYSNTTGSNNVAIGTNALYTATTGANNTVVGCSSDVINVDVSCINIVGFNNTTAYSNVNILGANISATGANRTFVNNVSDNSLNGSGNNRLMLYNPSSYEMSYSSGLTVSGGAMNVLYDDSANYIYDIARFISKPTINGKSTTYINIERSGSADNTRYGGSYGGFIEQGVGSGAIIHALNGGVRTGNFIAVKSNGVDISCGEGLGLYISTLGTGAVYSNSGILSNMGPSDPSLKKNIMSFYDNSNSILNNVLNLNPVQYEWIEPKMGTGIKYGFLADNVREQFPSIVSTWKDANGNDKLGYDPVSLIPILTSVIQTQQVNIASLTTSVASLTTSVASLTESVASLTKRLSALENV